MPASKNSCVEVANEEHRRNQHGDHGDASVSGSRPVGARVAEMGAGVIAVRRQELVKEQGQTEQRANDPLSRAHLAASLGSLESTEGGAIADAEVAAEGDTDEAQNGDAVTAAQNEPVDPETHSHLGVETHRELAAERS